MSVVDGLQANATTFNGAFVSRTTDTSTTGRLTLNNTFYPVSGPQIINVQRYINELADVAGVVAEGDGTAFTYAATTYWITNGMDRKQAIAGLDSAFDPSTGHTHDGVTSPLISAGSLTGINQYRADWFTISITAASGTSTDVSAEMSGKIPGGGVATAGVPTSAPFNKAEIRVALTGTYVEDADGQRVFARITESAGIWTLSYFTNEAGVETAHSLASTDITVALREVYTLATVPTFGSEVGLLPTYDLLSDIAYATSSLAGKVMLSSATPQDVAATAAIGVSTSVALADHVHEGIHSLAIYGDAGPALLGDVELEAGPGIVMSYSSGKIKVEVASNDTVLVEYPILSAGDITAKQVALSLSPTYPNRVKLDLIGGGSQIYGVDFTVVGSNLSWSSLALDGVLVAGDQLRISYVADEQVEYRTLSAGEISAKQLTLAGSPVAVGQVVVDVIGGAAQAYGVDFTVSGSVMSWTGLGLDGLVSAGDVLRISYRI